MMARASLPPHKKKATIPLTRGERVITFIERYCIVPEGKLVGKPMRLDAFQKRFIIEVYDNPHGTSLGILSIGRKNGKTGLIAAILLAHIDGPEARRNSQIVSGALSRDQAAIVFKLASKMVMLSDVLSTRIRIVPSSKMLVGIAMNVEYKALAAEAKTTHGLSPVLAILDELGQVRGPQSNFIDAITTAQGAHDNPLLLVISTQAPNDNDMLSIWIDDALSSHDPKVVCHLYAADKDAALDDRKAWAASNPALGTFRSLSDVEDQCAKAKRMPSFEPTFRNLVLNQRVEMTSPFVSKDVWMVNAGEPSAEAFAEAQVYVGLDLSSRLDLTSAVYVARYGDRWHVRARFWTPADTLRDRAKSDRAPYDVWESMGFLTAIPGKSIDYEVVLRDILDDVSGMNVAAVAFDRWRIDVLKRDMERLGVELPLVEFGQGFKDMTPAIEVLEYELVNGNVSHGANPVLTMCMANLRVERDPAGNRKFNKTKATGRIDGAVALTMAIGAATMNVSSEKSFWE